MHASNLKQAGSHLIQSRDKLRDKEMDGCMDIHDDR